jgi:hypothetical protein
MSYTAGQLLMDLLPRVGNLPPTGMTLYGAANSVISVIYKKLLERRSDLLATGQLSALIPAQGVSFTLPGDFLSPAEKPHVVECDSLIANIETALVGLSGPNLAAVQALFTATTGANVSAIQSIVTGQPLATNVQSIIDTLIGASNSNRHERLQPSYLDDDEEHTDYAWWDWYGNYGVSDGSYTPCHGKMKIISTTFYMRPKRTSDVSIKGRYFQIPGKIALPADVLPFNGLFDETLREGCIHIIKNGVAIPDADQAFLMLIHRDVETVLNSRISLTTTYRTKKRSFM